MKIAIAQRFLPSRSRGGVGYFTHGLANALIQRGHAVTVISQDPKPKDALYAVQCLDENKISKWAPLAFPFQLTQVDFSKFDVLHAQGDDQWLSKKIPRVRTLHGSSWVEAWHNGVVRGSPKHFFLHAYYYLWEWIADLRADYVTAVSVATGHYYPRLHEVIGNGIDLNFFKPGNAKSGAPSILFVGEIHSRKRGDLLLKIFQKEIRQAVPNAELWMVCPEKVEGPGIRCFSKMETKELAQLYQKAWVF